MSDEPEMQHPVVAFELGARGTIDWVKLDVSDHASRHAAVKTIRERCRPVEILVNNAG